MADSNIEQLLKQILDTKLGKDMRQSIHDGIEQCYEDGKRIVSRSVNMCELFQSLIM